MEHAVDVATCRICLSEGSSDRPLFCPCRCTGSIKYVHQDCFVQWLQMSTKKTYCEISKQSFCDICKHHLTFNNIYYAPSCLTIIKELGLGISGGVVRTSYHRFQPFLVLIAWLVVVPLTMCRMYRSMFSVSALFIKCGYSFPSDMLSANNLVQDVLQGCLVVGATIYAVKIEQIIDETVRIDGGKRLLGIENQDLHLGGGDVPNNNQAGREVWIGLVWDRVNFEKFLGLDGTFFLINVLWVIAMHTLFIFSHVIGPYLNGHACLLLVGFKLEDNVLMHYLGDVLSTLLGYINHMTVLLLLTAGIKKVQRFFSVQFLQVFCSVQLLKLRVFLFEFVRVAIYPLVQGLLVDICSLSLFNTTLQQRVQTFNTAPGINLFMHWVVGVISWIYILSIERLFNDLVQPNVLWFQRNVCDSDFNTVNVVIKLPIYWRVRRFVGSIVIFGTIYWHVRRFVGSIVIFGTIVFIMLWLPVQMIPKGLPSILPYQVTTITEADTFSMMFLLLHVCLSVVLLEKGRTREWFKACIRTWCNGVTWLLGLGKYMYILDDGRGGVEARNQALILAGRPTGYQPNTRPQHFILRLVLLQLVTAFSMLLLSLIAFTVPVTLGRLVLVSLIGWKLNELYTVSCGLYLMWLIGGAIVVVNTCIMATTSVNVKTIITRLINAMPCPKCTRRIAILITRMVLWLYTLAFMSICETSFIPLLIEVVLFALLVVPNHWTLQSLVRQLEEYYNQGLRYTILHIMFHLNANSLPIGNGLCAWVSIHLICAWTAPALLGFSHKIVDSGFFYGGSLFGSVRVWHVVAAPGVVQIVFGCCRQIIQCQRLYTKIKNNDCIVGLRLVNYDNSHSS